MLISVIIPAYNGEQFLREAIESILEQKWHPLEILVIDDGSTDRTAEIARSLYPLVSVLKQQNLGPASARNRGLEKAQGEYIGFLDADDLWIPGKLTSQVSFLKRHPQIDVVMGYTQRLLGADLSSPFLCGSLGCALFRKNAFEKVGFLDPSLWFGEDADWFLRAREAKVQIGVLQKSVQKYRMHQKNFTLNKDLHEMHLPQILYNSLRRRTKKNGGIAEPLLSLFQEKVEC